MTSKQIFLAFIVGILVGSSATLIPNCTTGVGATCTEPLYGIVGTLVGFLMFGGLLAWAYFYSRHLAKVRHNQGGEE